MKIREFFTKKRIIWSAIILLVLFVIGYFIFRPKDNSGNIQTEIVKKQDLKSTVLATGQVVSGTDLNLSFKTSGFVQSVKVTEGSKVKTGDVLATLDQKDALASLTSARGALAQAQANYNKVLAGASNEEIIVAQKAVDAAQVTLDTAKVNLKNTQSQQETAVSNAYSALLNSTLEAVPSAGNAGTGIATVSGTYTGAEQGTYTLSLYISGNGMMFQLSGLETSSGEYKSFPVPLGSRGLFIEFSGTSYANDQWVVKIPNTSASTYVANYNAYQSSLKTRQSSVDAAQAQLNSAQVALDQAIAALNLKKAQARPADLQVAQAQVLSAQGQVQAAQSNLENTIMRAPTGGTITKVDAKVGQQATAMQALIVLQDVGNLHVEANISEANISSIISEQQVEVTFDALGVDRKFIAKVQTIDPASTVVSGVVNYKVKVSLEKLEQIKPGMTANLNILTGEKSGVLAVPQRAVISRDGKKFVRVITDTKKKAYTEAEVTTGMEADGGLVEIVSGVSEGAEVVTFIRSN